METILKNRFLKEYDFSYFINKQKIGEGAFGIVFKSEWSIGDLVALKRLKTNANSKYEEAFINESIPSLKLPVATSSI
ncbi:35871_t:CDS:2 [Racocetra persica]|uniref:35871_t:CDS:1 n=1 Tax=Racocetra persica TaxID=160502 RepID=A0ACA9KLI0_9GLOM|nr:35871_t:CDS:2 [Racocetra persica]